MLVTLCKWIMSLIAILWVAFTCLIWMEGDGWLSLSDNVKIIPSTVMHKHWCLYSFYCWCTCFIWFMFCSQREVITCVCPNWTYLQIPFGKSIRCSNVHIKVNVELWPRSKRQLHCIAGCIVQRASLITSGTYIILFLDEWQKYLQTKRVFHGTMFSGCSFQFCVVTRSTR